MFIAATQGEAAWLTERHGETDYVRGIVYLAEASETRADAISNALRFAADSGERVFVYDADQTFLGTVEGE